MLLLTSMLKHSYAPEQMDVSTIIPIPKSKRRSLSASDNYRGIVLNSRGIALNSVLGKVIDKISLNRNERIFQTPNLQFGFKGKHSATHCTFSVGEVVNYYRHNGSDVYAVMLLKHLTELILPSYLNSY